MGLNKYKYKREFKTETGFIFPELEIAYTTYGKLNKKKDNVIWIIHALTGNSDPLRWWSGLAGKGKLFDTEKYFLVCSNNLGSCYGTTGPGSTNIKTGKKYGKNFPIITIRDIAEVQDILRRHLGIKKIFLLVGGSLGGQICLEWAIKKPKIFENIVPIATNARHSAWGIAFNETQRMALEGGRNGLETARAIAILSYRCYGIFSKAQTDNTEKINDFKSSSYQRYQGLKLKNRFDKNSYYIISKAIDSHNVGRKRGGEKRALGKIKAKTLVIGVKTDLLFPTIEQKYLSQNITNAKLKIIDSIYGHDGFLVESRKIGNAIKNFLKRK